MIAQAVDEHSVVIVDDFELYFENAPGCATGPRGPYHNSVVKALYLHIKQRGAQLVLATTGDIPYVWSHLQWETSIEAYSVDDYRQLFTSLLGQDLPQIDFDSVFRFAPSLTAQRIKRLCDYFQCTDSLTTAELLDFIQNQGMGSNVEVSEVQPVALQDLRGAIRNGWARHYLTIGRQFSRQ